MFDWTVELPEAEQGQVIEKIAQGIVRRGMEAPTILLLEMHKPVTFLVSQGLMSISYFIAPIVGFENVRIASKLLERRENVERLIQRIEELAEERQRMRANGREG
jgi:hypothetical protein